MAQTAVYEKMLAEIAQDDDHKYFDVLRASESAAVCLCQNKDHEIKDCKNKFAIDWVAFAEKFYRISESTSTVTSYCKGICAFKAFLSEGREMTLCQAIAECKATPETAYELLDQFVGYCKSGKNYAPRTTRNYFQSVTTLLGFCKVKLDEKELEDITMPRPSEMNDDYPENREIRAFVNAASMTIRGYLQTMTDTGFEPTDAAQLCVKDFKFNEDPVRISNIEREKTGQKLEGFLNVETVDAIKAIIRTYNLGPDDYVFCRVFKPHTVAKIRARYNLAVAKAGHGKIVRKSANHYYATVEKIDGHEFGKFHLKVYKKRWFTLAISAGVPEYVVQGMLGRKQYLDQYLRLPLAKKQEFARKILRSVSIFRDEADAADTRKSVASLLGLEDVTQQDIDALKGLLKMARMPDSPLHKILSGQSEANVA